MAGFPDEIVNNVQIGDSTIHYYVLRNPHTKRTFAPATFEVTTTDPLGATTTYTAGASGAIENTAVGAYNFTVAHNTAGRWVVRLVATGECTVVKVGHVNVVDTRA